MTLMTLQDCDHGTDYDIGSRVQSPPFNTLPFTHVYVTCRQCQQSEILPDLLTRDEIEEYEDWAYRQIEMDERAFYDPQYEEYSGEGDWYTGPAYGC